MSEQKVFEHNTFEKKINEFFGDAEATGFGTGWWSGVLSAFFGFLSFGGVLCLHFPQILSSPELRVHYPMHTLRVLIQCLIVGAILFGIISSIRRKKKTLALAGMLLAIAATAWGGSSVQINDNLHNGPAIGLDWFLLDLFLMALIYVPLERVWPQYPTQGTFRNEWTLDVVYFMSTHLPIQILSFLVLLPATQATKYLGIPALQHMILRLPWLLQFFLAVVVADLSEYFIHLALHKVPFLWRFHAVHHSSKALDWIAGSRSHFVDDTLVRGFIFVPYDVWIFAIDHFCVSDFCHASRHLDPLQFRSQRQMDRAIPGHAPLSPLAPYFAKRGHRQELRHPFSVDRQDFWDLLLSGPLAGALRVGRRGNCAGIYGADD